MPSRFDQPDAPSMPSSTGPHVLTLTCRDCQWTKRGRPIVAVSAAVRHGDETGHAISYKGVVQQFSGRM